MRDDDDEQLKIELLSQWKLEAESRNKPTHINEEVCSCEVNHPARYKEEEDGGFEDNPTTIEGSEGG